MSMSTEFGSEFQSVPLKPVENFEKVQIPKLPSNFDISKHIISKEPQILNLSETKKSETEINYSRSLENIIKNKELSLELKYQQILNLGNMAHSFYCDKNAIVCETKENILDYVKLHELDPPVNFSIVNNEDPIVLSSIKDNLIKIKDNLHIKESLLNGNLDLNFFAKSLNKIEYLDYDLYKQGFAFLNGNKEKRREFLNIYRNTTTIKDICISEIENLIQLDLSERQGEIINIIGDDLSEIHKIEFKTEIERLKKSGSCTLNIVKELNVFFKERNINIEVNNLRKITQSIQSLQNENLKNELWKNSDLIKQLGFEKKDGKDFNEFIKENSNQMLSAIDKRINEINSIDVTKLDEIEIKKYKDQIEELEKLKKYIISLKESNIAIGREKTFKNEDYGTIIKLANSGKSNAEIMSYLENGNADLKEYNERINLNNGVVDYKQISNLKAGGEYIVPGFSESKVIREGNLYKFKIGNNEYLCSSPEEVQKTIKMNVYLKKKGLGFMINDMQKILDKIQSVHGTKIKLSNVFENRKNKNNHEANLFFKSIFTPLIPGYKPGSDINNELNISIVNSRINDAKKDKNDPFYDRLKNHISGFSNIEELGKKLYTGDSGNFSMQKFINEI